MDAGTVALLVVLGVPLAAIAMRAIRVVPMAHTGVVERLGRYHRTVDPGLHVLIPIIDRIQSAIDLREQLTSVDSQCITNDNARVAVGLNLYHQVTDPVRAVYEVADSKQALAMLAVYALRNAIGSMTLAEAQANRDRLNEAILASVRNGARTWGTEVNYTEVTTIDPQ